MLISQAVVSLVDDSTAMQLLQIKIGKDEVKNNVERIQTYGLSSHPLQDAEVLACAVNGNKDHIIAVAVDDSRYRIKGLPEGGVALYDYDGNVIKLTKDDGILVDAPNADVNIKASGDINIGNSSLKKLVNDSFKTLFNSHTHSCVGVTGTIAIPALTCAITAGSSLLPNEQMDDGHLTSKVEAE